MPKLKPSLNSWTKTTTDGVIDTKAAYQAHTGALTVETSHNPASRRTILERNKRLRIEKPFRRSDWMRPTACIPMGDLERHQREDPELLSTDPKIKRAAYMRLFILHPEYLVVDKAEL